MLQLLTYILEIDDEHRTPQELIGLIESKLTSKTGDGVMSVADMLREEGREEGREEVRLAMAKRLLSEGVEPAFVAKVAQLPLEKILALQIK